MKKLFTLLFLVVAISTMMAQTARDEIKANPWLAGSNYVDYDRQLPDFKYTATPAGYVPFYFTHYGRHGSRWLIGDDIYERVLKPLRKAAQQGKLSDVGQQTLNQLEQFNKTTYKRLGDLTTVGERQHHGLGKRIVEHFPEIFKSKGVAIDARSTVVTRCVLSMVAECEEFMAANPTARIHNDVSESLQYYLNQPREGKVKEARDNMDRSMQSHDDGIDMLNLFTNDELYDQWSITNVSWYLRYANAPQSNNVLPFSQYNLLKNFIETADSCVAIGKPQATLRFGHEVCVMPLACLMELGTCNASINDLEQLDRYWQNYKIFPMASNIQLIFYKPKSGQGDILVKALLNEREVTLPVEPTGTPYYYKWTALRKYWTEKLANF